MAQEARGQAAEATDSLERAVPVESVRSPLKAALYSAAVPGMGQAYNRKYWKIPLVYGLLAGGGYALYQTNLSFEAYTGDYLDLLDGTYQGSLSQAQLESIRSDLRKQRENWAIGLAAFYALGVMDAAADAFLADFDVGEGLSVHFSAPPAGRFFQKKTSPAWGLSVFWRF